MPGLGAGQGAFEGDRQRASIAIQAAGLRERAREFDISQSEQSRQFDANIQDRQDQRSLQSNQFNQNMDLSNRRLNQQGEQFNQNMGMALENQNYQRGRDATHDAWAQAELSQKQELNDIRMKEYALSYESALRDADEEKRIMGNKKELSKSNLAIAMRLSQRNGGIGPASFMPKLSEALGYQVTGYGHADDGRFFVKGNVVDPRTGGLVERVEPITVIDQLRIMDAAGDPEEAINFFAQQQLYKSRPSNNQQSISSARKSAIGSLNTEIQNLNKYLIENEVPQTDPVYKNTVDRITSIKHEINRLAGENIYVMENPGGGGSGNPGGNGIADNDLLNIGGQSSAAGPATQQPAQTTTPNVGDRKTINYRGRNIAMEYNQDGMWRPVSSTNQSGSNLQNQNSSVQGKNNYGLRPDGTQKGTGFLGELKLSDGGVATEYSVGVRLQANGGKETDIPSLVPTLTKDEVSLMVNDIIPNRKPIPDAIMQKAVDHANMRMKEGKSVFADEQDSPVAERGSASNAITEQQYLEAKEAIKKNRGSLTAQSIIDKYEKEHGLDWSGRRLARKERIAAEREASKYPEMTQEDYQTFLAARKYKMENPDKRGMDQTLVALSKTYGFNYNDWADVQPSVKGGSAGQIASN